MIRIVENNKRYEKMKNTTIWCEGRWLRHLVEMFTSDLLPLEDALFISQQTTSGQLSTNEQDIKSISKIYFNIFCITFLLFFWINLWEQRISGWWWLNLNLSSETKTSSLPNLQRRQWCLQSSGSSQIFLWCLADYLRINKLHVPRPIV